MTGQTSAQGKSFCPNLLCDRPLSAGDGLDGAQEPILGRSRLGWGKPSSVSCLSLSSGARTDAPPDSARREGSGLTHRVGHPAGIPVTSLAVRPRTSGLNVPPKFQKVHPSAQITQLDTGPGCCNSGTSLIQDFGEAHRTWGAQVPRKDPPTRAAGSMGRAVDRAGQRP